MQNNRKHDLDPAFYSEQRTVCSDGQQHFTACRRFPNRLQGLRSCFQMLQPYIFYILLSYNQHTNASYSPMSTDEDCSLLAGM